MKKFNKNIIVFVFAVLFIGFGMGKVFFTTMSDEAVNLAKNLKHGKIGYFSEFTDIIDDKSSTTLNYHDNLIDINSFKERVMGTRIIEKDSITIAKTDDGNLVEIKKSGRAMSQKDVAQTIEKISELRDVANENGAEFLYCAAPRKEYFAEGFPENTTNCIKEDFDTLISELEKSDVPYLDASKVLQESGIPNDKLYFNTDHHWRPYTGFVAASSICEELNRRYGFEYNKDYADINNYNIETYDNLFLGSHGKKTGRFFTPLGADEFDLITPKFETSYIQEQPFKKDKARTEGSFDETVIFKKFLEKDYYSMNTYVVYSGGDIKLQIMKNQLNPDGKKILLVRDSFACITAPFLSLQTSELHLCDMRNFNKSAGKKVNVEEYIKEISPDYVILLYSGISTANASDDRYDFF